MKIPINEAARRLHLHPCELVLELAQMATSFDDLYPEVEEGFVETLKQMRPERFFKSSRDMRIPEARDISSSPLRLSRDAEQLVSALERKGHWGTNKVSHDTLKNHYCRGLQDFDSAVKELIRGGILLAEKHRGPFSLNPKARTQVDALIRKMAESPRKK